MMTERDPVEMQSLARTESGTNTARRADEKHQAARRTIFIFLTFVFRGNPPGLSLKIIEGGETKCHPVTGS